LKIKAAVSDEMVGQLEILLPFTNDAADDAFIFLI